MPSLTPDPADGRDVAAPIASDKSVDTSDGWPNSPRGRAYTWWLVFFAAFFLVAAAWAFAAPYEGFPDEKAHVIRAAGVWYGGFFPEPSDAVFHSGAAQPVPRGLVVNSCWPLHSNAAASCVDRQPSADHTIVRAPSATGRYHPVYYLAVGWPMRFWSGWSALIIARLCSTTIASALLAMAATIAIRYSRRPVFLAGVLVAVTPLVLHLAGGVNPSSLELAAAVPLFVALFSLVTQPGPVPRPLVHATGLSAVLVAVARTPGPLWLAIGGVAVPVLAPWSRLRTLLRDRAVRWWLGPVALAGLLSVAWTIIYRTSEVVPSGSSYHLWDAVKTDIAVNWMNYVLQAIGVLSWVDSPLPSPAYIVWLVAVGALVGAAFIGGSRRERWTMAVLGILGFTIPSLAQAVQATRYGLIMQGRYLLPILVSVPILSGRLVSRFDVPARIGRSVVRVVAVFLLPIHLLALEFTLARWMHGMDLTYPLAVHLNPLWGFWHPVDGVVLPFALMALGIAALLIIVWRATRGDPPDWLPQGTTRVPAGDTVPSAVHGSAVTTEATGSRSPSLGSARLRPAPGGAGRSD